MLLPYAAGPRGPMHAPFSAAIAAPRNLMTSNLMTCRCLPGWRPSRRRSSSTRKVRSGLGCTLQGTSGPRPCLRTGWLSLLPPAACPLRALDACMRAPKLQRLPGAPPACCSPQRHQLLLPKLVPLQRHRHLLRARHARRRQRARLPPGARSGGLPAAGAWRQQGPGGCGECSRNAGAACMEAQVAGDPSFPAQRRLPAEPTPCALSLHSRSPRSAG